MYNHSGTTDFLKWCLWIGATFTAVMWISGIIGGEYTLLIIGAIALVVVFAAGALFAHMNQRMTLDAFNKANATDAQIDRVRMQSFKALASGDAAMQRAAAQLTVLDAKRVDRLADQRAKMLTDVQHQQWQLQQQQQTSDTWTWDDADAAYGDGQGDSFQEWR